ncbi:MAG: GAF domain-containing protein [Chloroflexi bacterium]|nr:GAF domain-containing protein [Chloroflexota bacterium]
MLSRFLDYIRSDDDQDPSFIRLVRNILIIVMLTTIGILPLVTGITGEEGRNINAFIALLVLFVLEAITLFFVLQGKVLLAKLIIPIALILAVTIISIDANGLRSTSTFALPVILVISAILLGRRSLALIAPLAVITTVGITARDMIAKTISPPPGLDDAITAPILLLATAGITQLLILRLNESVIRAQQSEQIQRQENIELITLRASLEERVHERTAELQRANLVTERRARQFQAIAKVMNAVSSVQSLDQLLPLITNVISEQFDVYHVGIFLLDNQKEFAILRAANSEGGRRMLDRNHKLLVGQTGIVGFVTATGQPRIALDVGTDSVYFDNPDLPDTRSEIALPLRYTGEIIGALDVQSVEPDAFSQDDIEVLSTLSDQVSVAINNALAIESSQRALAEAQSAIGQTAQEAWQILRPKQLGLGYIFSETGIQPLQHPIEAPHPDETSNAGETRLIADPEKGTKVAVPIRLRGKTIGMMHINARNNRTLTSDDADIAQAVAERLSLAIETATLLQSTQHRADLEKVTANITSKISSSSRFETILQTTAQELSRALGGSDVIVQIEPAALKMYT